MFRRILRSFALAVAVLTAGIVGLTATPTTATASPVKGMVKNVDTLPANNTDTYTVELRGEEETQVGVAARDADLEVRIYGPSGDQLGDRMTVPAGKSISFAITPNRTGKWKIAVSNRTSEDVKYGIVIE